MGWRGGMEEVEGWGGGWRGGVEGGGVGWRGGVEGWYGGGGGGGVEVWGGPRSLPRASTQVPMRG